MSRRFRTFILAGSVGCAGSLALATSPGMAHATSAMRVAGVELAPAPSRVQQECRTAADWVGYAVPCPQLLPKGSHSTSLGWPVAGIGFIGASLTGNRWAFGSIEFPSRERVGHLTLQASPRSIRDPTRFVDAAGWTPSAPSLPVWSTVLLRGRRARFVDAKRSDSFNQHHTVLMWTARGHTYGVAFHGRDRAASALDLAIARHMTLVSPRPGVRHPRPLEILPPPTLPKPRRVVLGPASRTVRRQCRLAAGAAGAPGYGVGFPVPCPTALPRGARPSRAVCLGRDWSLFVVPSCIPVRGWVTGSIDFPAPSGAGHLYLQGAPASLTPEQFVYRGWSHGGRVGLGTRVSVGGTAARWLVIPAGSTSPFAGHVAVIWKLRTTGPLGGVYTYGVSVHGHGRSARALTLAIARGIVLLR